MSSGGAPVRPALRVEILGGFRVVREGRHPPPPTARQQQLIAYLILHATQSAVPRQRVAGALWPDSTDPQALTNLRRELHHLREDWRDLDRCIDAGSRTLAWRGEADVIAFEAAAERGLAGDRAALQEAARLYRGDVLPDCAAEWIEGERARLRNRASAVLAELTGRLEQDGNFPDAIASAEHLLRIEPLREDAWCALMRCHARRGERAAALHVYQECAALLKRELGVQPSATTRVTYREILDLDADIPTVPPAPRSTVYPLVGRDDEWRALLRAWREAEAGRPQLVVIRGEAGIGKTRLAEELVDWCRVKGVTALTARCYAGEGRLAYAPIAAWLKSDALRPCLATLDASALTDVARLLPEVVTARPDVAVPDRQLETWQRLHFFESVSAVFRAAGPSVLVVDDLQWADADTIDWIQYFVQSTSSARSLIVAAVRAEEEQDNPALGRALRQLGRDGVLTVISIGPLDREATALLAGAVAERPLDETTLARTFRDTEGHPLFIIERGRMEEGKSPDPATENALSRVQSVVAARLAILSPDARAVAEVASAVGRDFTFDLLSQACDLDEAALVRALDELWRRHIVRVQNEERWDFSHDRIREVAYGGIGPARAPLIHRRIARGMEVLFADRLDDVSAAIGMHLQRGGQAARSVPYLQRAASVAARISANEEAIRCLMYALSILETLPDGRGRGEQELALRSSLSVALNSARGYADPEVERNLDRVFALLRATGDRPIPVRWLWVAFTLRFMLGDLTATREVAAQALAQSVDDPSCRCEAHHAMAASLLTAGNLEAARQHFEAALAAYDERHPRQSALGSDLGVFAHAWYSHALWLLGDDEAAVAHAEQGIAWARRLEHPYSETLALAYAAMLHQMRRDAERTRECAEGVLARCDRYGFAYYGDWARALIGWARGLDDPLAGVQAIEDALTRLDARRAQARRPYYMSLLAETYRLAGKDDRAAAILDDAIRIALHRSDLWWLPALYFQRSELDDSTDRDSLLRRGLELARAQNNRGLERRIVSAAG